MSTPTAVSTAILTNYEPEHPYPVEGDDPTVPHPLNPCPYGNCMMGGESAKAGAAAIS